MTLRSGTPQTQSEPCPQAQSSSFRTVPHRLKRGVHMMECCSIPKSKIQVTLNFHGTNTGVDTFPSNEWTHYPKERREFFPTYIRMLQETADPSLSFQFLMICRERCQQISVSERAACMLSSADCRLAISSPYYSSGIYSMQIQAAIRTWDNLTKVI